MVSIAMPRVRTRRRGGGWGVTWALCGVLLAVSAGLGGLVAGSAAWLTLLGAGGLVLLAAAALRSARLPAPLAWLAAAAAGLLALTASFGDGHGVVGGVLPTGGTLAHFRSLFESGAAAVQRLAAPAPAVHELLFLVAAAAIAFALLADFAAAVLRAPALVAVPVASALLVPTFVLDDGVNPVVLTLCAIAFIVLLAVSARAATPGSGSGRFAWILGVAVVAGALVVSLTAPGFARVGRLDFAPSGVTIGDGANPLVDLGRDLRRPAPVTVITYSTSALDPPYLRLTSLDDFTGATWKHVGRSSHRLRADGRIDPPAALDDAVHRTRVTTSVDVADMSSPWLPVPFPPVRVRGMGGTWTWNGLDGTISGVHSATRGRRYTVTSLDVQPTERELRGATGALPEAVRPELELPYEVPEIIVKTAHEATRGDTSSFQRAMDLQSFFQSGAFSYSERTPLRQGYDGDGLKVIATFLQVRSGYCVHFASAMAIMARVLGIPSRIGIGYLPGDPDGTDEAGVPRYRVSSRDLHAWPELYFSGVGWVRFEPTVGRGFEASFDSGTTAPDSAGSETRSTPERAKPLLPEQARRLEGRGGGESGSAWGALLIVAAALAAIGLLLTPAGVRVARRRRRRVRARRRGRVRPLWDELVDEARDLGLGPPAGGTPRAGARVLKGRLRERDGSSGALSVVLAALEAEAYGPDAEIRVPLDEARAAALGLRRASSLAARVRAFLFPRSLGRRPARRPWAPSEPDRIDWGG